MQLTINKQCQNKLINQKAQYYQQSVINRTKQLGFDIYNKGFNKFEIDKIMQNIIDFCLKRWEV